MKKIKKLLIILLMLFPTIVFASDGDGIPLIFAIFMEAFVSIHISLMVLRPLSEVFTNTEEAAKKLFWKMFAIRIGILLFFDFFITTTIAIIDFVAVFLGGIVVVPLAKMIKHSITKTNYNKILAVTNELDSKTTMEDNKGLILKCTKCSSPLKVTDKFCENCGEPFSGDNVEISLAKDNDLKKVMVVATDYDPIFQLPEDKMVEEFIKKAILKADIEVNSKLLPKKIIKRKNILNIIFSFLIFVFVSLIFFHFPIYTYIIGLILIFIFYKMTSKFDLIKYLKKQLKARPSEKISNIVMSIKPTLSKNTSAPVLAIGICLAIILPLIIFNKPRILYEKMDNGYGVRFYAFGLTNFTSATIPETYNNEKVISLRGNTFSNMPFLEEVTLPDTITEIRGQAFKNNKKLIKVNLPKNLEYLGGGAFYNCTSLTSIEIPDTVTYIGGETFYNATSLQNVKLSNSITEIRGNTFENCTSLESIIIPDSVTRIGAHAFYGNSSLREVVITENSKLTEIGSSAFRMCDSLYTITIPNWVYVNERAFKESPTNIEYYYYNY